MPLAILCAGRLREAYWRDAAQEYIKRLSRYDKLEILEVADQPEGPQAMKKEGEAMLGRIKPGDYVVALCIDAPMPDSVELSALLRARAMSGSRVVFVIGGSLGLHEEVLERANARMSMSKMTFPHQLARVMLLEQLYRAHKILSGERYHK